MLKFYLCDFRNAYNLVRGDITIIGHKATQLVVENCAPSTKCIINIHQTTIDDDEDLDLVMPMYNLIEHSSNYSKITRNLLECQYIGMDIK